MADEALLPLVQQWQTFGQAKVVVKIPDEDGLLAVQRAAPPFPDQQNGGSTKEDGRKSAHGTISYVQSPEASCHG